MHQGTGKLLQHVMQAHAEPQLTVGKSVDPLHVATQASTPQLNVAEAQAWFSAPHSRSHVPVPQLIDASEHA